MSNEKLVAAIKLLKMALKAQQKSPKDLLAAAALAKSFEVAFQYVWKNFKQLGI